MSTRRGLLAGISSLGLTGFLATGSRPHAADAGGWRVTHSDAEWRRLLTPAQYTILRHQDTEAPGSSPLDEEFRAGRYDCVGCGQKLFSSTAKFDSHTGWPSFWQALAGGVSTADDKSLFMSRTEVHCSNCGGHLGHLFDDGPKPTGLRYCMNGAVLSFHLDPA